jgi:hypothetical protein
VADEEAFFIVVGVDEPTGDFVGVAGVNFPRLWMKNIDTVDSNLRIGCSKN